MKLDSVNISSQEINLLRQRFEKIEEVVPLSFDIQFSSKVASYGIYREVGTINDEMARFIFDANSGIPVRVSSLKAELITWKGLHGVRIYSTDSQRLELRTKGSYDLAHPGLSANQDGSLHSLFIFPELIRRIAHSQGVELVLVKSWGKNSIFGGFDPAKEYYQTNFWELENNDALRFSDLVRRGQIPLLGTHDLIAHIAGVEYEKWANLKQTAENVYQILKTYFQSVPKPSIAALILPYTVGVILDDLAQPPSYNSQSHLALLDELLLRIASNEVPANLPTILTQFPLSFQKIIEASRTSGMESRVEEVKIIVNSLVEEIRTSSLVYSKTTPNFAHPA